MTVKLAFFNMVKFACPHPVALVVTDEEVAVQVETKPIGRPQPACPRNELTLLGHLANPTPVGHGGIHPL